ncbi:type VII secretion target [Nocardia cyriacigeorgica]|uniref:type VII secretion target n=1 Tax=Nocardia cyriacigeorgica TaxID=135487 RepID=UPI002457AF60|nr:type VII secretion target [Nocardia cyriacigeorgica]
MSEALKVEPTHLDGASTKLAELAQGNALTETYLKEWLDLPSSEGGLVLRGVIDVIQNALIQLQSNYARLGRVTSESSAELVNAAKMYRTTDRGVAEALDRTYEADDEN